MPEPDNSTRARDHLANERTFLAWMRTGLAVVVFGFAIGRFAIAIREFAEAQGHPQRTAGLSVWFGVVAIVTGIVLAFAGLNRYRRTRAQLESGRFEPAGSVIDLVAVFTMVFGLALAVYLIYVQQNLHSFPIASDQEKELAAPDQSSATCVRPGRVPALV